MLSQLFSADHADTLLDEPGTLAVIKFGSACVPDGKLGIVPIGLGSLNGIQAEVLKYGSEDVKRGANGQIQWASSNGVMFAATWLDEDACGFMQQEVRRSYVDLVSMLRESGYPNIFRMWNFLPDINREHGDLEVYKRFCAGRHDAFTRLGILTKEFPAASAVGHHTNGAVIYALASPNPYTNFENPEQTSAYHYPREYGPRSPSFARATSVNLASQQHFFVSGTSSIIGHKTQAAGALDHQLRLTIKNIERVLSAAGSDTGTLQALRVYLRHPADLKAAKTMIDINYHGIDVNYLLADICRSDLLVEVECATTMTRA